MSSAFLFCRLCGLRYRSDQVDKHEKTCGGNKLNKNAVDVDDSVVGNAFLKKISSDSSSAEFENGVSAKEEHGETRVQNERSKDDKEEMVKTPYPSVSDKNRPIPSESKIMPPETKLSQDRKPKQAWNANAKESLSAKSPDPEPTKKYRHYPVSCEFCDAKMQPGLLRKHIEEEHPEEHLTTESSKKHTALEESRHPKTRKSAGARFRLCYICGRQFGSKSLPIHEPQCLDKWRIQNEKLPKDKRMPEPVKQHTASGPPSNLPGSTGYSIDALPDLTDENEAAYASHLRNLVPCSFCGRKFNPDRVMVHEGACIQRPKKRTYLTPDKNKIL